MIYYYIFFNVKIKNFIIKLSIFVQLARTQVIGKKCNINTA